MSRKSLGKVGTSNSLLKNSSVLFIILVICGITVIFLTSGVAAQETTINVEASGQAELVGYADGQNEQSHNIGNDVELTFSGEDAQNVNIIITPQEHTVIDAETVNTFIEGDREISLQTQYRSGEVELSAEEIPADTTVIIEFDTIYTGGTTTDETDSAVLDVTYQTLGGTSGEESFPVGVDLSSSADNRITEISQSDGISLFRQLFTWIGVGGIALLIITIALKTAGFGGGEDDVKL